MDAKKDERSERAQAYEKLVRGVNGFWNRLLITALLFFAIVSMLAIFNGEMANAPSLVVFVLMLVVLHDYHIKKLLLTLLPKPDDNAASIADSNPATTDEASE